MKTLRFLYSHLGRFRLAFWLLLLAGGLDGIANFAVPILLSEFTKEHSRALELTRTVIPLLAVCMSISLALQWCLRRWAEALCTWFGNKLRAQLFRDVEALRIETLAEHHSGYIAALINQVAGSVGSLTRDHQFESTHRQFSVTINCILKIKVKKRGREWLNSLKTNDSNLTRDRRKKYSKINF